MWEKKETPSENAREVGSREEMLVEVKRCREDSVEDMRLFTTE